MMSPLLRFSMMSPLFQGPRACRARGGGSMGVYEQTAWTDGLLKLCHHLPPKFTTLALNSMMSPLFASLQKIASDPQQNYLLLKISTPWFAANRPNSYAMLSSKKCSPEKASRNLDSISRLSDCDTGKLAYLFLIPIPKT